MSKIDINKIGAYYKWSLYIDNNAVKMGIEKSKTKALERAKYYRDNVR